MNIFQYISSAKEANRKLLAILLDPEKTRLTGLQRRVETADLVLVGGSTGEKTEPLIKALHEQTDKKTILFPGNIGQVCPTADALLFLSLLSSRNADMLIGQQVRVAKAVKDSGIETISMGYILIDGGKESSVERMSQSRPLSQNNSDEIVATAIAAELMGMRLVYLEAGSGAETPVKEDIITAVRQNITLPLIVGGGIRTTVQMHKAFAAGADIVVIGNHFEEHPEEIPLFKPYNH